MGRVWESPKMVTISRGPSEPGPVGGEAEPPYPAPEWQSYGGPVTLTLWEKQLGSGSPQVTVGSP